MFAKHKGPPPSAGPDQENAKRQQILEGARRSFMAHGFDAASMGAIAREAGVSKGTLYVYFDSKEALFSALINETRRKTAERLLAFESDGRAVEEVLEEFGKALIAKLTSPENIALLRMVIGASERFPEVAQDFYRAGPAHGANRLSAYLTSEVARGRLSIEDTDAAAWQFLGMCNHPVLIGTLASFDPPDAERTEKIARAAVRTFMAAYGPA
ncbi:MAG: TetR/AcrR family transcriptional regulator [Rhodobacteraceae bacterium]|uniref:TetR/AcrR family transcriptional regulator n=1 Tax=Amaricoccus sp. B4 TaxID=3368557 RepID=UPI000DACF023|nr:TetR/AcrR family transcriptional regulator [Paracoccaceae bacterium]